MVEQLLNEHAFQCQICVPQDGAMESMPTTGLATHVGPFMLQKTQLNTLYTYGL
jgi:hypothetical protein